MKQEQWVAFDGKTRVHQCGQEGDYEGLQSNRSTSRQLNGLNFSPPNELPSVRTREGSNASIARPSATEPSWLEILLSPRRLFRLTGSTVHFALLYAMILPVTFVLRYWWMVAIAIAIYWLAD
jgi:hypothetical protein